MYAYQLRITRKPS